MYSFSYLEPACCSISSSNLCFLICTEVSQEAGQLVWYSHLFQNFPQFIVIHTEWRSTRPFRTNTQKWCPFHYRGLECKCRKSRNTWGNRQIWPWNTDWSKAKANRGLPRERTGHSKYPLPTTQKKTLHMDITRWSTPKSDWLYSLQPKMEKLYTVSKNKTRNCVAQIMNTLLLNSDLNWRK